VQVSVEMRTLFHQALTVMGNAFRRLEQQVPPPQKKPWKDSFVFRYKEQTIEQALIQKLARSISGLHAVDILLLHGLLQEQGVLHRTLDEIHQDIFFLAAAITNDSVIELHKQYLASFWAEAFDDPSNPLTGTKKPNLVPRRKISAYVTRILSKDPNPSRAMDVDETISSVYSGFIHAASPQIMDMLGGDPPKFHISGLLGTGRMEAYIHDAWNYFYRGLLAVTVVAKAFGDKSLVDSLNQYIDKFERGSGTSYSADARNET